MNCATSLNTRYLKIGIRIKTSPMFEMLSLHNGNVYGIEYVIMSFWKKLEALLYCMRACLMEKAPI